VSDLRLLFDKANREDITVEITDIRTADGVPSAPLTDCAPELVAAWECYRPALLEDIQEQQWLTADIVLREIGELHPIRAPTLLITAQDADSAIWWDKILPHIRQQLPQTMEVDLLYAPRAIVRVRTTTTPPLKHKDSPPWITCWTTPSKGRTVHLPRAWPTTLLVAP